MSSQALSIVAGGALPPLRQISMAGLLTESAQRFAGRDAVISVWQGASLTYAQLEAAVSRAAAALRASGIGPGDRVGIWSANRIEWVIVQFAVARVGAILVNINPAYRQAELHYVIEHAQCQALFVTPQLRGFGAIDAALAVQAQCAGLVSIFLLDDSVHTGAVGWTQFLSRGDGTGPGGAAPVAASMEDSVPASAPVSIQYTSGTTGKPKGATLTHFNLVNNCIQITARMGLRESDRICLPVPMFHCFGMSIGVLGAVTVGAAVVFPGESFDAAACLNAVEQHGCTAIYAVPMMFIAMLNHPQFDSAKLRTLRTGLMGGAPCPAEVLRATMDKMHMREVMALYGMTETAPISFQCAPADSFEQRVHTVGSILPHTEAKIIDPASGAALPIGERGELCVRGYLVMPGYWDNPDATAKAIDADGWMHTGDLAIMRADRYIAIAGRIKDMVIRGGENIFPREIEEFLHTLPEIAEAQVFGVPDPLYGEQLCAWIRLKPGAVLDALTVRSRCKGHIASFKIPAAIRFVEAYPATASGKPQKFRMSEMEIEKRNSEAGSAAASAGSALESKT